MSSRGPFDTPAGRAVEHVLQSATESPGLRQAVTSVLDQRMTIVRRRLDRAADQGELPPVDAEFLSELLLGPVRLHVGRGRRPFTRADAEKITDVVLAGVRATAP